ncbi:MAG: carbamoyltransferase C-terminal domain-containing protein [Terrimicrobiaceae bacterium]
MKKESILGISALGHDAAAALVCAKSGEILYAIAEERLNNLKHSWQFPYGSIRACQAHASLNGWEIVEAALNFNPEEFSTGTLRRTILDILKDEQKTAALMELLSELIAYGDFFHRSSFSYEEVGKWIARNEIAPEPAQRLRKRIGWYYNWSVKYRRITTMVETLLPKIPVRNINHHLCHAASTYFTSGFENSCVITWDGQGESQTTCVYHAKPGGIELVSETVWPSSLGMIYFGLTNYLGFKLGDEFKVMGMAAYGQPRFYDALRNMIEIGDGPSVHLRETDIYSHQEHGTGHYWYYFNKNLGKLASRRFRHQKIQQEHFDLAASLQKVFEDFGSDFAGKALATTGEAHLCLSGGVALNGLMNEAIRRQSGCKNIYIYPAAGDDGTAVGAALQALSERGCSPSHKAGLPFLGGGVGDDDIRAELQRLNLVFEEPSDIHERIAKALAAHEIVARYQGRSEFGPRALGNRSILANPARPEIKDILNERIKHREAFRPFAPACLLEFASDYFDIDIEAPYMLLIATAKPLAREKIPAAVHADGTSRLQTVSKEGNGDFYKTIKAFHHLTGTPVVINTSFNINGEAIVETPCDAVESFSQMDIDHLAIGKFWISKAANRFPKMTDAEFLDIRKKRFSDSHTHVLAHFDINKDYFPRSGQTSAGSSGLLLGLFRTILQKNQGK